MSGYTRRAHNIEYRFALDGDDNHFESFEESTPFTSPWEEKPKYLNYIASDAAEHFFHNNDGWECDWPITFGIYNKDKKFLGAFSVEVNYEPNFDQVERLDEEIENDPEES